MSNLIIEKLLAKTQRTDIPAFRPGDTVRVHVKIKEGDKERVQAFEGVVIKRDNGPQASFTVRKISFGQGVERIFPMHSKVIDKVDLVRSSKVRRARLFYLRGLRGKAARLRDVERPHSGGIHGSGSRSIAARGASRRQLTSSRTRYTIFPIPLTSNI